VTPDLRHLQPVGLAELDLAAALRTRKDRKYLVPIEALDRLLEGVDAGDTRVLEIDGRRSFGYESVYFDTPDHACHRAAAHRRPRRIKVRTRRYLDGGTTVLEAKVRRGRGLTAKHRLAVADHGRLTAEGLAFLEAIGGVGAVARRLRPALVTRYRRTTLLAAGTPARMTIDTGLECIAPDGGRLHLPGIAIVETKSAGPATAFDRLLWAAGHRPVSISKYGTGLAALDPTLPANKWHRVLRDHFGRDRAATHRTPAWSGGGMSPALVRATR
jgi:hypothetical protein